MEAKEAGEKLVEMICDFAEANQVGPKDMLVAMSAAVAAVTLAIQIATVVTKSEN